MHFFVPLCFARRSASWRRGFVAKKSFRSLILPIDQTTKMNPLILSEIWIYPIKSLGGIPLETGTVQRKGLQYDRRWMLIDQDSVAMTQRAYPDMALFKPRIRESKLSVRFVKNQREISCADFSLETPRSDHWISATVWNDNVDVLDVDPGISEWFTHHLGTTCRLVAFPEDRPRLVNPDYSVNQEQVSLADAYPFLIIGQASLEDLNKRLDHGVPMNRFRPNFVFTGGKPFDEDHWRDLSIGEIPFAAVKRSDRCVLTTVNQETAAKGHEPLRTLSRYRKVGNKVYFGQNLVALAEGDVRVGDPVIPA